MKYEKTVETYVWDKDNERILIDFSFNKNSFEGTKKSIPQKAWIHNKSTQARLKEKGYDAENTIRVPQKW